MLARRSFPYRWASLATGLYRFGSLCGNRQVDPGEDCDTGGQTATCDDDCTRAFCGDAHLNPARGEICDGGDEMLRCTKACVRPRCGDRETHRWTEECDRGPDGDMYCDSMCRTPTPP
jgi:hypothetical protein